MITRRTLIKGGAAASLCLASAFPFSVLSRGSTSDAVPFHALLFDGRYEAGKLFGQEASQAGVKVHDIGGDTSGIWYRDLRHHWKEADVAIAGLTTFSSFFSLRMMSDTLRIRPQYLGYHHLETGVRHELFGPESLIPSSGLDDSGTRWPSEAARLVLSWSHDAGQKSAGRSNLALAAERYLGADSLVSWILAPHRR
jgi:hypothetical protein